jgi:hypothetical protein
MVGDRKVTHSDFAALRHDVLKGFKGASLYKVSRPAFYKNLNEGMSPATGRVSLRDIPSVGFLYKKVRDLTFLLKKRKKRGIR